MHPQHYASVPTRINTSLPGSPCCTTEIFVTSLLPRLIRSTRLLDAVEERIHSEFDAPPAPEHALSTAELLKLAHAYQPLAVLVTHTAPLKGADVAALPESVKLVATVSVGLDHLDVPALLARDIAVSNTPDVLTDCNADLAIMLILAASRRAAEYYTLMKAGWGHALGMGECWATALRASGWALWAWAALGRPLPNAPAGLT